MSTSTCFRTPSFTTVLVVSSILRVVLILYSEWHDAHSVVKYTDVDYRVFSDATRFVLHPSDGNRAQGPLGAVLGFGECVLLSNMPEEVMLTPVKPVHALNISIHTTARIASHSQ